MKLWLALIGIFSVGTSSYCQSQTRVPSVHGDLRIVENFESKILGNKRTIRILLPADYNQEPRTRYAVVYMHDGQNLFDGDTSFIPNKEWRADETSYSLAASGLVEKLIIVGIDNAGVDRANEYLPTKAKMGGDQLWGGMADLYSRFIVEELMPYVSKNFRTKSGPSHTATCGSSFGGIVALHLGMTRPDVFGKVIAMSPSVWWDGRAIVKSIENMKDRPSIKIWTDMGTNEGPDGVDQFKSLRLACLKKGWRLGRDFASFIDEGAAHNEDAWARRLGMALMFMFPKK